MKATGVILLLLMQLSLLGQVDKGMMAIGGNADMSLSFQADVRTFNMSINPSLSVFGG